MSSPSMKFEHETSNFADFMLTCTMYKGTHESHPHYQTIDKWSHYRVKSGALDENKVHFIGHGLFTFFNHHLATSWPH